LWLNFSYDFFKYSKEKNREMLAALRNIRWISFNLRRNIVLQASRDLSSQYSLSMWWKNTYDAYVSVCKVVGGGGVDWRKKSNELKFYL
jgi:hypothetical protein